MGRIRNITSEEDKELKRLFYKTMRKLRTTATKTEASYLAMNLVADEFTSAIYRTIDVIFDSERYYDEPFQ